MPVRLLPLAALVAALAALAAGCPFQPHDDDTFGDDDTTGDDDDTADDDTADDDTAAGGPDIVVQPPNLAFAVVCVGDTPSIVLFLANAGDEVLQIQTMAADIAAVTFDPYSGAIAPDDPPVQVEVTASCSQAETLEGALRVISNDPDESPLFVPIGLECASC